ncbi:MAG: VCBS repeat-containing protein [Chitinophagaceae bacterium]|nr:VCBS repeat-containing protein [Chitinophagaceae bacterium]
MNRLLFSSVAIICTWLAACKNKPVLFEKISSSHSGISFNNRIIENDSVNPLDIVNIYNGGGVGIGDFNNDGLQDIYFSGNMVPNRLYLNKGDFKFEDVTETAGVDGMGRWGRGVAVIDINNDGLQDIYVCNTISKDSLKRRNILYLNKGINKDGIPHFDDAAKEYGLDIAVQSTMANFFDADNDGDLDMYLTVNEASDDNMNRFGSSGSKSARRSRGRLFQNNRDSSVNHPVYRDISNEAGINRDGYGHAATIVDINCDGWKDIYVTNDFLSENILYINNHNGTFTDQAKNYFKHTSYNAMGQDVIDINNDGLADIIELDMNPEDNYRKKMMLNANNITANQNFEFFGNQYQYVRNTLQLNQGPRMAEDDTICMPVFSEIGFMSGVSETDWSWAPVVTDFDNDGFRDIIVTNGFPKDVSDHDFMVYREEAFAKKSKQDIIRQIPQIKLENYAYRNNGDLSFTNTSVDWGINWPAFSNGAAFADLDNNGTLDLVVSNINDEPFLYKNTSRDKLPGPNHYLQIEFNGGDKNRNGIDAWADIYYGKMHQAHEHSPYRGYLSTMQSVAHFGVGATTIIDSVVIRWPNGRRQVLQQVKADQVLKVNIADAEEEYNWPEHRTNKNSLFKEITKTAGINYKHLDFEQVDFNIQVTLPHKLSEYCPALAVGDLDKNGLEDIVLGGNSDIHSQILFQQSNGKFIKKDLGADSSKTVYKDGGILIFDADGDGSPDIYFASGGYKPKLNNPGYQDRIYINDGKGNFTLVEGALPANYDSKLCVRSTDFNNDGRPDIFVAGRVKPWEYPKPVSSTLLRNDSEKGKIKFTDVTEEIAPGLKDIGMVCDALFTDFDNDGQVDLLLAGEWMPITFFKNTNGKFTNVTTGSGIGEAHGWWNSIVAGDFRHTGRTDYIIGNVGLNTLYQATEEHPVYITANDFDKNGGYEAFVSLFLADQKGQLKEFPANNRDDVLDRLPSMKKQFNSYKAFASATMDEIFPAEKRVGALRLKANMLQSCFVRNDGNGKFTLIPLPKEAQFSNVNAMLADDFDGDGNLDVMMNGNDFGTEVSIGRYDALNGLLLKGDGSGGFAPLSIQESGIYIPDNGRALVKLMGASGNYLVAASQNKNALKLFELRKQVKTVPVSSSAVSATIKFKDGKTEKREFYSGSSFLSQSSRSIPVSDKISSITILEKNGKVHELQF